MYRDQFGEFGSEYWGLKGYSLTKNKQGPGHAKDKQEFMFFFTLLRHSIVMNKVMENHSWTFVYNAKCINTGTCASYITMHL